MVRYILSQSYANNNDTQVIIARCRAVAPVEILRDSVFAAYAQTLSPQGIAAICRQQTRTLEDLAADESDFLLIGENLQDPGNVGTLIRTAAAAGAGGAIFTLGSADIYSAKVQRAAAGAALRLPVISDISATEVFAWVKARRIPLYAAHPRGDIAPYELDMKKHFCLLVGNEARGISGQADTFVDAFVRLPMAETNESLNAALAGGIMMYEAVRQRYTVI